MKTRLITFGIFALLGIFAAGMHRGDVYGRDAATHPHKHVFLIKSSAFKDGQRLPKKFTADGVDISPPLTWSLPPNGTKSLLIIMFDPDAPGPMPFLHWVVFNIAPQVRSLPAGIPPHKRIPAVKGARQGKNSFGGRGYGGPAPPLGKAHHYHIEIYALSRKLVYAPDCFRCLQHAIAGYVLAQAGIRVTYGR